MSASNTWDCFRECVGRKIVGVLRYYRRGDETRLLIFDDGTGLSLHYNGSYWRENAAEVRGYVDRRLEEVRRGKEDLEEALRADGVLSPNAAGGREVGGA